MIKRRSDDYLAQNSHGAVSRRRSSGWRTPLYENEDILNHFGPKSLVRWFENLIEFRMHELSEKLLNFITKDGKCSNLEKLLSNVEDAKELGNDWNIMVTHRFVRTVWPWSAATDRPDHVPSVSKMHVETFES